MGIKEEFAENVNRWLKDQKESLRYDYPLDENSVVLDIGFYRGEFTKKVFDKYGCNILAFEPVHSFYQEGLAKLPKNKKIHVFNVGIGKESSTQVIYCDDDKSSLFQNMQKYQLKHFVEIISIKDIFEDFGYLLSNGVDLVKINIEGGEYDLLEFLLDSGLIKLFKNIQIQFHIFMEDAEKRRNAIRNRLIQSHRLTYDYPWVWENWARKDG